MSKLVLIRGLPGSGKSTKAREMGMVHLEADMYFMRPDGHYSFVGSEIKRAHEWCQALTRNALQSGDSVVVSNTFVRHWEMQAYLDMAKEFNVPVEIVVAQGNYQNIHNVPKDVIERMRSSWED